ncbi:glycine cleavage system aminomethyltransferase GcvT [Allopusillimonas soli]|uniref:Aminomethyltransferase n=1 Tax=Allopusillimonas soli TaxID=659016 RepID=A0A853F6Z8_9BURK|nr:glycine cleavage system aminomethyltransferase GcvT [Allopusillimonas soli]NYT35747.1 glycine cleavage system aminomethyltransferase GcvT [Allopusillimonas soli]TEA76131.1 glycine cleavage system aminomethyltransferase GcvT [Allopusillimonas soli]
MSDTLKHTPLHSVHLESGAKMVDFGGWDMPVSYGSQIEEHHAVRREAGMFDVSHMLNVDIEGEGVRRFLSRLLANDVAKLSEPGKALYSCMLKPDGGVIDDLIVYFFEETHWRAVVNAGTADKDVAWMRQVAGEEGFKVDITPRRDLAMVAVQGPQARAAVWAVRPSWEAASAGLKPFNGVFVGDDTLLARTGYTGEDGFEVVLPANQVAAFWKDLAGQGVRPCGLGARDTLRLEAGMNLYGQDMDEQVNPLVSGLGWTVSFKNPERDFIGRKALEAAPADRTLVGVRLLERGVMRGHMKVRTSLGDGELTSGSMSPTMGVSIGMARVPAGVKAGDAIQVEIRGKWLPAEVVKMPFVRNGAVVV